MAWLVDQVASERRVDHGRRFGSARGRDLDLVEPRGLKEGGVVIQRGSSDDSDALSPAGARGAGQGTSRARYPSARSGARIEIVLGDITHEQTDIIVSSASPDLEGSAGVEAAIRRRAGVAVLEECKRLRDANPRATPPNVIATGPGALVSARAIIHASGPNFDAETAALDLGRCYADALTLADQLGASSISMPAISTGRRGYPMFAAAPIALRAVRHSSTRLDLVRFVLFDKIAYRAFVRAFVASL